MSTTLPSPTVHPAQSSGTSLVVLAKESVAEGTVALTLAAPDGSRLPDWAPGAHLDLLLGQGRIRQYSLCGDRWDPTTYRVGVKLDREGRGGSRYVHDELQVGDVVDFGGPRNTFRMHPAASYLFLGAGIGITPMLPMIDQAARLGVPWRCVALARTRDAMPFLDELLRYGDNVEFVESSVVGRCDLRQAIGELDGTTGVYACGPERFLTALGELEPDLDLPVGGLRVEHFTATADSALTGGTAFELELARSGRILLVGPHQTALEALRADGPTVLASCERGLCGTCETDVLAGIPDHRDSVLAPHERAVNDCFIACVSRSRTPRLTVDL
jgi:ferredoxin-NADP reductase